MVWVRLNKGRIMEFILKFFVEGWNSLTDSFVLKAILSGAAAVAIWVIGIKHVQILGVFILLVFIDLLIDEYGYDKDQMAVWEKYRAIPLAFEKGLISSRYMRKGFVFKILTYVAATMAAVLFDEMSGQKQFAVSLVWLYLGSCEFLSIMENLRDGGNVMLGKFLDLIRTKIENKVKL